MRRPLLALLIFVAGACSLGSEIAAARLLAPYFGSSTIIWANTIAIVLLALSLGYWLGGRLADRHPTERAMRLACLLAACLLAAVPLLAGPFFGVALKAFEEVQAGAFLGSLGAVLLLAALPLTVLGCVSPWAVRLALQRVEDAGTVAGRLYAISTAGSLVGVFLAAVVLVPAVGTQRTFLAFAAALALAAASWGLPRRALLVPAVLLGLLALPPGVTKESDDGRILAERETEYQYARVVQDGDRRLLELNEGRAVHSVYDPTSVLTDGVWDGYLVAPFARLNAPPRRMAMLGNAAGTVARAYRDLYPGTRIDGVEIDGELTELGEEYFDLRSSRLKNHAADARPFLRQTDARYDLIAVDAYRQPYIPFYLATTEFFELVRDRLTPGGAVVINVGHPEGSDALEKALAATLREVFPNVMRYPKEDENTLLIASEEKTSGARLRVMAPSLPVAVQPLAYDAAEQIEPALSGGDAMTDDRAPVEWLIDRSIVEYAAGGGE